MLTSSSVSEEDHFRLRLDSINKEMQAIIERTAADRDRLLRSNTTAPPMWCPADGTSAAEVAEPHSLLRTAAPPSVGVDEAAVRRIVADEMNMWRRTLQEMFSQALGGINGAVKQRLEEMSRHQAELAESLRETTEASRRGMGEMQSALSRVQRGTSRSVEDLARDLEEHVSKSTLEQTRLRDAVSSLQNDARIDQQRGDRRFDELVRRHHDLVRNSLLELDAHVSGLRDELQAMMRAQTRQTSEEQDAIQQHVARLQGALEATNDTTVKWVAELRNLMEENATWQSEMRTCRRDFNRLEMLLQGVSDGGADVSVPSRGRGNFCSGGADGSFSGMETLCGEFVALKERINSFESKFERMNEQMMTIDETMRSLFASGSGNASLMRQNTHQGAMGNKSNRPDSLDTRTATGTSHPHSSQQFLAPAGGDENSGLLSKQPKQHHSHYKTTIATHDQHAPDMMTRLKEASHSVMSLRNLSVLSPKSCSSKNVLSFDDDLDASKEKQHPHQPENSQRACFQSCTSNSPGVSKGVMGRSAVLSLHASHHSVGAPQLRDQSSPLDPRTLTPEKEAGNTAFLPTELPTYSNTSTPPDSYVSERSVKPEDNDRCTQYVPAPTSDVESELDNKKMARLALD